MKISKVEVVSVLPGDVVVLKIKDKLRSVEILQTLEEMKFVFPSNKCVILDGGAKLEIKRPVREDF